MWWGGETANTMAIKPIAEQQLRQQHKPTAEKPSRDTAAAAVPAHK